MVLEPPVPVTVSLLLLLFSSWLKCLWKAVSGVIFITGAAVEKI